jgi:hypothetical protein
MNEQEIDYEKVLKKYRTDPYDYINIHAPHTGRVRFQVKQEDEVKSPSGEWRHIPGTILYTLHRERNNKPIKSLANGVISEIRGELDGHFVEAGEKLMTIRHPLTKKEIIEQILKQILHPFPAPERAKYFFSMDIQSKVEKYGSRAVAIKPGEEIFTMSLMKRDTPVYYEGEPGIIHSIYFQSGVSVNQSDPLIGICPENKLFLIKKIITKIKAEFD